MQERKTVLEMKFTGVSYPKDSPYLAWRVSWDSMLCPAMPLEVPPVSKLCLLEFEFGNLRSKDVGKTDP